MQLRLGNSNSSCKSVNTVNGVIISMHRRALLKSATLAARVEGQTCALQVVSDSELLMQISQLQRTQMESTFTLPSLRRYTSLVALARSRTFTSIDGVNGVYDSFSCFSTSVFPAGELARNWTFARGFFQSTDNRDTF